MRVSDYILSRLADEGITHAFTVYGGAISELIDAFLRQDKITYVCPHHEQGAGFMAEGWAKAKGNAIPGLAIVTSGPGGGNLVTPIQDCFYDSTPCIFITGQVNSKFIRPTKAIRQLGFQETDIVGIVKPITKYATLVTRAEDIRHTLTRAIHECLEGRKGPVLLDIPGDIQKCTMPI